MEIQLISHYITWNFIMNKHMQRIKYISEVLNVVDNFYLEFREDLLNKRIKATVIEFDKDYDLVYKEVIGIVHDITFHEYDISITGITDDGIHFYVDTFRGFEVLDE